MLLGAQKFSKGRGRIKNEVEIEIEVFPAKRLQESEICRLTVCPPDVSGWTDRYSDMSIPAAG